MENNFSTKIGEIKKIFSCWLYRKLSPYGKVVIIKTLALSKLSHAALVVPSLGKNNIKELESLIFNFLWDGKPDKVARESTKISEKLGGMRITDIKDFWSALKFSWILRSLQTVAVWPKILEVNMSENLSTGVNVPNMVEFGPHKFDFLAKNMGNLFWKEIFYIVKAVMNGAVYTAPEKLILAPLWENPAILNPI